MKNISIIAAMDENRGIGKDNKLPWHIPEDLRLFKKLTKGKNIIMGRKTYESIGRPLPHRNNVVVTKDPSEFRRKIGYDRPPVVVDGVMMGTLYIDGSLDHAINNWSHGRDTELFVIGGAEIYKAALPYATKMYITRVYGSFDGDAFFPEYEDDWDVVTREVSQDDNHTYEFQVLEPRVFDNPKGKI